MARLEFEDTSMSVPAYVESFTMLQGLHVCSASTKVLSNIC